MELRGAQGEEGAVAEVERGPRQHLGDLLGDGQQAGVAFEPGVDRLAARVETAGLPRVDSVRLAFRTKNLERMSISPTGNVGIGVKTPTAQLHTTGTVRFAGMTSDSTKTRVLVSDTSGNLFYRNVSSLSGRWQYVTGTQYDSSDNIGLGTGNTQG